MNYCFDELRVFGRSQNPEIGAFIIINNRMERATIRLSVRTLDGVLPRLIEVERSQTIASIKVKLEAEHQLYRPSKLFLGKDIFKEEKTVTDYDLEDGDYFFASYTNRSNFYEPMSGSGHSRVRSSRDQSGEDYPSNEYDGD